LSTLAGLFSALLRRPYLWAMPSASFLPLRRTSALLRPIEIVPELLAGQDRAKRERFRAEERCSTQIGSDGRSGCGPMRLKMSP
jgi:hypothetical protein